MEYQLSVKQRIVLLSILPDSGDLTTIRIIRELREGLSFTEAEHAALEIKRDGEHINWNQGAVEPKTIDIGPTALSTIHDTLKKLDKQQKLTEGHLPIIDLFEYEG